MLTIFVSAFFTAIFRTPTEFIGGSFWQGMSCTRINLCQMILNKRRF